MTHDQPMDTIYLRNILGRESADANGVFPIPWIQKILEPVLREWAGRSLLNISPSGSFAKGTANKTRADIDLFVSLSSDSTQTLREIYNSLHRALQDRGYNPRRQNVSLGINIGRYHIDLVPAKRQDQYSSDHLLYRRKAGTWVRTNIANHIRHVRNSGRCDEIRIIKLWRDQKRIEFGSFHLELTVINALYGRPIGALAGNVRKVFEYLRDRFASAYVIDPSNFNNVISDELSGAEKRAVISAAQAALDAETWGEVVR